MENKVGKFCSSTVIPPRVGILLVICCYGKHVRIAEATELEDTGFRRKENCASLSI